MEILDILRSRYTTKTYDSTFHLSDKQLEDIKEMLRLCPSSINSQPWAFELIGDRETKSLLAQHSYSNKDRIEQASHLLVIYNYRDVATFEAERIATLSEGAQEFYRNKIASQGEATVLGWMRSQAYITLGVALMGLASMELDSTPMEGIDLEGYETRYSITTSIAPSSLLQSVSVATTIATSLRLPPSSAAARSSCSLRQAEAIAPI